MIIDGNMIMSGLVSKFVNDIGDKLKKKIKDAGENRKSFEQSIETRIYQVTIDAINVFTSDKYKGQEKLYDAVESILSGFKIKKENNEVVRTGMKILGEQLSDDRCVDFLEKLRHEICKDENDILYKEIDLMQNEQTLREICKGFEENTHNQGTAIEILDNVKEDTKYIREFLDNNKVTEEHHSEIHIPNRAEEYAAKWDKNVFLNDFNKRDKNAGVNIKLKDIYLEEQLPHYTWKTADEPLSDLKELLREYTVDNDGKNMLLILGQPGIGKSTLITWIIANFVEKKDDILVFQFASDLKNIDWQGDKILGCIFQTLKMKYNELENKVLILDGFDEIYANSERERILNKLNQELASINILKNFSLIITCRENYVSKLIKIECVYIILQTWDEKQIKSFCDIYRKVGKSTSVQTNNDKLLENKEIFGIPLILYMVMALDITIEKSESLVDVYDQIFSLDRSSIYDRCINNSRFGTEHRISENKIKQAIHQISQRIAFWIFENNSEKAYIPQKEYEDICSTMIKEISNGNENIKRDFLIGNYFKLINHCDGVGTQELHFVHRSLYEYFVVVYFSDSLHNLTSKEAIAGKLGILLKDGCLSEQILEFIKYRFDKMNENYLPESIKEVFQLMMKDGMTYYIGKPILNVIKRERNIFSNMLEMVVLWNHVIGEVDERILIYLQCNRKNKLNLKGIKFKIEEPDLEINAVQSYIEKGDLEGVQLIEANLMGADLAEVNLTRANLKGANLEGAVLKRADIHKATLLGANLQKVDLSEMNLRGTNLLKADLHEANLNKADLRDTDFRYANLDGADLRKTNLNSAYLSRAFLSRTDLRGANLNELNLFATDLDEALLDEEQVESYQYKDEIENSRVYISETKEILNYQEYCNQKQKE